MRAALVVISPPKIQLMRQHFSAGAFGTEALRATLNNSESNKKIHLKGRARLQSNIDDMDPTELIMDDPSQQVQIGRSRSSN